MENIQRIGRPFAYNNGTEVCATLRFGTEIDPALCFPAARTLDISVDEKDEEGSLIARLKDVVRLGSLQKVHYYGPRAGCVALLDMIDQDGRKTEGRRNLDTFIVRGFSVAGLVPLPGGSMTMQPVPPSHRSEAIASHPALRDISSFAVPTVLHVDATTFNKSTLSMLRARRILLPRGTPEDARTTLTTWYPRLDNLDNLEVICK